MDTAANLSAFVFIIIINGIFSYKTINIIDQSTAIMKSSLPHLSTGVKPSFLQVPDKNIYREFGQNLKLRCKAAGKPRPQVIWFKNGEEIHSIQKSSLYESKAIIIINKTRVKDGGYYMCVAKNEYGRISTVSEVIISGEEESLPTVLRIIPKNVTISIGKNITFDCYFKSKGPSIIQWLKNSQIDNGENYIFNIFKSWPDYTLIQADYELRVNNNVHSHRLILKNVQSSDTGAYMCLVFNMKGYSYNITYLYVESKVFDWRNFSFPEESTIFLFIPVFFVILVFIFSLFAVHRTKSVSPQNLKNKYVSSYVQTLPCPKDNSLIPYISNIKPGANYSSLHDSRGTNRSRSLFSTEITSDVSSNIW